MAPRKSRASGPAPPTKTLILDNGAYTLKAGYSTSAAPRVLPNCIARDRHRKTYISSELSKCKDFGEIQFRRPVDKGFVVSWEAEKGIWEAEIFAEGGLGCDASETRLILAEPPAGIPALQTNCDQMVFEEFRFASYYRAIGPTLNAYNDIQSYFQTPRESSAHQSPAEIMLLIDSGYSHTTVTPLLHGRPLHPAVRRLDIGGKFLTNYLTRLLSLRHFDMRNDTYIVNELKETACYVSLDFSSDLEKTWKGTRGERRPDYVSGAGIAKDYVLPDFQSRPRGTLRDYDPAAHTKAGKLAAAAAGQEDVITLRNERFTVPELLFHPMDIGMRESGIPGLVMQSLAELPLALWPGLLSNVVVVGGNAQIPGFRERLQRELVMLAPDDCAVRVAVPQDPITATWEGGKKLADHADVEGLCVTREEYEEYGAGWVARKFAASLPV
ncbi:related to actin-like protein [Cephalotrichum gorgonifer]|uniref:Related to actin-like protein n=1 Tax=Cephalotrichum gorgonifer TaxID=2041049 RepID=A0AAE8SY61_9PEZI|nr:related to actin-like protein [Cephalotrichum gorgonifer]